MVEGCDSSTADSTAAMTSVYTEGLTAEEHRRKEEGINYISNDTEGLTAVFAGLTPRVSGRGEVWVVSPPPSSQSQSPSPSSQSPSPSSQSPSSSSSGDSSTDIGNGGDTGSGGDNGLTHGTFALGVWLAFDALVRVQVRMDELHSAYRFIKPFS